MHDKPTIHRTGPDADALARGYETRDVNAWVMVWLAVGFIVGFVALCGGLWWFYNSERRAPMAGDASPSAVAPAQAPDAGPPLQPQVGHESLDAWDLAKLRKDEDATFAALGWQRDERTHRFTVPAAVVQSLQQRAATRPATQTAGGAR